ncbi:MAG: small multi-drug export protein [Deltaproteobacteria bacterium]|nr:small multi-drug export protein [Deltaproteobacteria bacterium]
MIYIKKIFSLILKGSKKVIFLIRNRFDLIEVKILFTGLTLALITCLYLLYLLFTNIDLYKVLSYVAVIHTVGGRAMGIALCLSAELSPLFTILYNFLLEVIIVLIAYGITVLIMRNIIEPKLFRNQVREAELTAQKQKSKIKKYGAVGLFIFVMLPFFMTGPLIGSIIGYLLNYRAIHNFMIVFSGTLSSIVIYTLVGNSAIHHINQYVQIETVKKWVSIVIGILILLILVYHLKTVKAYLDQEIKEGE